jgi:hypothetical protein
MRQFLPIPSAAPFSASPRAATILATSGSKHSTRRIPDMSLFRSPTPIASPLPHDPLRHPKFDTNHLRALRYYPHRRHLRNTCSSGIRDLTRQGRAAQPSSARDHRARAAGRYPAVALAATAGAHAISVDFSDIFLVYPMFFYTFPCSFYPFRFHTFSHSSSSMYLFCNLLRKE